MTPKHIEERAADIFPRNVIAAKLNYDRRHGYITGATDYHQLGLEFAKWCAMHEWRYSEVYGKWYRGAQQHTDEQLFQIFYEQVKNNIT